MIYGIYYYTIGEISDLLNHIRIPHSLYGKQLNQVKKSECNLAIVDGLQAVRRVTEKNIIVIDSKSALLNSNVDTSLFNLRNKLDLQKAFISCSKCEKQIKLEINEPTLSQIIDKVTTKSVLTDIQTLVNKVNPYDLRKKVHKLVISYFYGSATLSQIKKLKISEKLRLIYNVLISDKAKNVRNAVLEYKQVKDENKVANKYKVHTFEILYVYNSFHKL